MWWPKYSAKRDAALFTVITIGNQLAVPVRMCCGLASATAVFDDLFGSVPRLYSSLVILNKCACT